MRKRKLENADSLDMLLDTISNLFGCIIFLTLFVSILTGQTAQEVKEDFLVDNFSTAFLEKKIEIREAQLAEIFKSQRQLELDESVIQEIEEYKIALINSEVWKEKLKKRLNAAREKREKLKKRSLTIDEMSEDLDRQMRDLKNQIENARSTIKKNSQLPRFGLSGKERSMDFWVTGGRMYDILNKEDCVVLINDGVYNVFLLENKGRPSGGFDMPPKDINDKWPSLRWKSIIQNRPPSVYQANFYIAPDSAESYLNFVQRFEKKGYAIRPTLLPQVQKTLQLITVDNLRGQ